MEYQMDQFIIEYIYLFVKSTKKCFHNSSFL